MLETFTKKLSLSVTNTNLINARLFLKDSPVVFLSSTFLALLSLLADTKRGHAC